ncbi:polysaccharide deacetylase family protein [Natronoflexus pectinivorans]|uniref:Polysaccharide deacetylase n=1 Tax=Natronoflexus pectinivorans TaxID=682526 RepID=A0A4R2GIL7_9BACT|nr:hypothetical protein [Natronoflexus pectinivorans]TCO08417.1 hypothetical protein EV194_105223 [Natronoflexus pectinivorans]
MKHLILTVDYELFFGSDPGTVENCMIRPVRHLMEVLDDYEYKMTVFWDVLHFYRLKQLEDQVDSLRLEREMIEKQIRLLIKNGHDVQMHIHPHWLDARWENNRWHFSYMRFSIHKLWDGWELNNIETIPGCITICKNLIEEICKKENPGYKVRAIRAGGYRIEPFERLAEALKHNNIRVDASAAYGMKSFNPAYPFDFRMMPPFLHYRFNTSVLKQEHDGFFWEFPKESIKVPVYIRMMFWFLRNMVYPFKSCYGDGTRLRFTRREQSGHWISELGPRFYRLTPEDMDKYRWSWLVKKSRRNGMVVLHSKNMGPFTMDMLKDSLAKKEIAFHSLADRIKALKVYDDL